MYTGTLAATSNRETWTFLIELIDPATMAPFDLVNITDVQLALRAQTSASPALTGSLVDGHLVQVGPSSDGTMRVTFSMTEMSQFAAGEYDVGIRIKNADATHTQLMAAHLPIVDGVVNP